MRTALHERPLLRLFNPSWQTIAGRSQKEMILLAVLSTLTGALLAMRFKVFVLFPAMLVIVALNIVVPLLANRPWHSVLSLILSITGLQLGFFMSCLATPNNQQKLEVEGETVDSKGPVDPSQGELEAARAKLDDMVAELQTISKQMPEESANPETADRPATAASR
jgi:hypothetical protein